MFSINLKVKSQSYISTQTSSASGNIYHTGGYLGIGTISPLANIHVTSKILNQFPKIRLEYQNVGGNPDKSDSTKAPVISYWDIEAKSNFSLNFGLPPTASTTKFTFTNSGNLGIGTTTPESSLHIKKLVTSIYEQSPAIILEKANTNINCEYSNVKWKIFPSNCGNNLAFNFVTNGLDFNCLNLKSDGSIESLGKGTFGSGLSITGISNLTGNTNITGNLTTSGNIYGQYLQLNELGNTLLFNASNGGSPTGGTGITSVEIGSSNGIITFYYSGSPYNNGFNRLVCGDLWAKGEIVVDTYDPWPDFVFEPDYDLMSLTELENYVTTNKHLPEIPTATEITENGQNIGELNVLLVKKIEELTLYIIDLQKQIDLLKAAKEE